MSHADYSFGEKGSREGEQGGDQLGSGYAIVQGMVGRGLRGQETFEQT